TALHCGLDGDEATANTRDCTLDEQQVGLGIDLLNLKVLRGYAIGTHAASHALALEDAAWGSSAANATDAAVSSLVTVSSALTSKSVALHSTSVAVTLGGTGNVNKGDTFEDLNGNVLADLVSRDIIHADFCYVATWGYTCVSGVAGCLLVCLAWVDLAIGDLDSVVAIVFYGANLGHNAWPSLDDGYRYYAVLLVEDLSHAELLAQNALDLVSHYYFSTKVLFFDHWLLMSTLAGRSMRIRASTVFGVGSRMSMRRLWVRISKCSRESLYLCGERITA